MGADCTREETPRDTLSLTRVLAVLTLLLVLALVLPFTAVKTLHARRLGTADRDLLGLAALLARVEPSAIAPGTQVLVGPGARPQFLDDRWNRAPSIPLSRVLGGSIAPLIDPWGNAYLVIVNGDRQPTWVMSAGADGIIQTPFDDYGATPSGDDRAIRVRPPSYPK